MRRKTYFHHPVLENLKVTKRPFFTLALYRAVNRASTNSVVSWSSDGKSFIVWNQEKFYIDVLPKLVMPTWTMFTHYLKLYGFREVESGRLEFANDDFVRGKIELTSKIERKYRERFNVALLMKKAASYPLRGSNANIALLMAPPQGETSKALTMCCQGGESLKLDACQIHSSSKPLIIKHVSVTSYYSFYL
ncbi:unnamed protein product [Microthlaspi erraticum]|uniref:HSF-type DNA-binding domain-containing protein n=1 Tax=Microthlaspi erraticum TaxID=1685480 RepID=A0A6D2JSQ5_9BRAS|nr:unnamed protein product [Microthlaspi erraticum]